MTQQTVVIVGAGAAGLMAAIFAANSGARVVLLDGSKGGGRKILISGGGRCNVLPENFRPDDFLTDSSRHALGKILSSWPLQSQRAFFEAGLGVALKLESETAKLFPVSDSAKEVRDALVGRARVAGVEIRFGTRVIDVAPEAAASGRWRISTIDGSDLLADRVVVASGGLSVPKTGSDGWGFGLAQNLGLKMVLPYPALTPLLASPHPFEGLAGISITATVEAQSPQRKASSRGGFLFTHKGFSGPAVLDVSHVFTRDPDSTSLSANFLNMPSAEIDLMFQGGRGGGTVGSILRRLLPSRLVDAVCEVAGVEPSLRVGRLAKSDRKSLVTALGRSPLGVNGSGGFAKAEVTGGGIELGEVNPKTMESRRCPGLFFCGEVLDAFGPIGGFNFSWAWITGRLAGMGAGAGAGASAES